MHHTRIASAVIATALVAVLGSGCSYTSSHSVFVADAPPKPSC